MNLEFGGGETPRKPSYKQVDIRNLTGIDYVSEAWDIHKIVPVNSVDNIYSRHFFEHLTFAQGSLTLWSWGNILKVGGKVEMIIPNLDFHIDQWIAGEDLEWAEQGFWGKQRGSIMDTWDIHKSGYTEQTLKKLIESRSVFKNFSRIKSMPKNLHVEFYKK